ncbi:MAG: hypothetical protein PHF84_09935 [bacterium]|nr:hypothetical protein [bacterium]
MAEFKAFETGIEVNGETILSVVAGMEIAKNMALDILKQHGIDDPRPGKWYSQQSWLDSFKTISEKVGSKTLNLIGRSIPNKAQWPPQVNSIEAALASIDVAYHMNHRKNGTVMFNPEKGTMIEGIGHYGFEKIGEKKIKMVCKNPYPCEFDKGIIEAAAKKFSTGEIITVAEDTTLNCRKKGGDVCTYLVSWR